MKYEIIVNQFTAQCTLKFKKWKMRSTINFK